MARIRICLLFYGFLCVGVAGAVEWEVEPSIGLAETFTDNLGLDPDGREVDEFATEITPAIRLTGTGKQFQVDFEYRLQGLFYSRRDDLDEVLNYSSTSGNVTLIDDRLFVDFSGSLNQQIVTPDGRIGLSGISNTGNRQEVGNFSVRPYFQSKLGKTGTIRLGTNFGVVEYDDVGQIDSNSHGFFATIAGAPPQSSWSWKLDGTDATIDYDTGAEVDLRRIGAEIAWSPGGKMALFVGGGDESNEFTQLSGARKSGGSFWNVGIRGELDNLTTFSLSAGEEYYGSSYQFSLVRKASKLTTDISYVEETTTVSQQQQNYEALFQFLSEISGVELPSSGTEVYIRKRLSAIATLELARSRVRLNAYNEDREYLNTALGTSDGIAGTAMSWTWTGRPRSEFSVEIGWQRLDLRSSMDNPEDLRFQVRFQREIGDELFVNVRAWRNSRFATVPLAEYTENAIGVGIDKRF